MITIAIINTICTALAISLITLWRGGTLTGIRVNALVSFELIMSGLVIAIAALSGTSMLIDIAIAWLIQAAAVIIVITKAGAAR